jgi:prepilin-type N-terminal cleavage/methylation domain-containing protein
MTNKINNQGMSLLELIISIAISAIVILMIVSFLSGAFRTFRRANDEVNLQMEAQTTINQITKLVMEAKEVSAKSIVSTEEERYLIDKPTGSDYGIIFRKDTKKLYLEELDAASETYLTVAIDDRLNLMTEYVGEFEIASVNGDNSVMNINLKLFLGADEFSISKKVNLRNAQ